MRRFSRLLTVVLSFAIAAGTAFVARQELVQAVSTETVAVARDTIAPYTIVGSDGFVLKEMPRLRDADFAIYRTPEEAAGKIATQTVPSGALLYRGFFADPRSYRLTDDPHAEILSVPVKPEKAVGGAIRPGMHINLYRIAVGQSRAGDAQQVLDQQGAASQVLARDVLVVDTRTAAGTGLTTGSNDLASSVASLGNAVAAATAGGNVQILTVAVPSEKASDLIRLVGETQKGGAYDFWVTLAPLRPSLPHVAEADPKAVLP
jgi:hypothetical protein